MKRIKASVINSVARWLLPRLRRVEPKLARAMKAELGMFNARTLSWDSADSGNVTFTRVRLSGEPAPKQPPLPTMESQPAPYKVE